MITFAIVVISFGVGFLAGVIVEDQYWRRRRSRRRR
jgi:hypothetical protein